MPPEQVCDLVGLELFAGGDPSIDGGVGDVDVLAGQDLVEHAGVGDLAREGDTDSGTLRVEGYEAVPVVKRIVPRPASRIGPSTAWTAATAPMTLNSSGPRMSSAVV